MHRWPRCSSKRSHCFIFSLARPPQASCPKLAEKKNLCTPFPAITAHYQQKKKASKTALPCAQPATHLNIVETASTDQTASVNPASAARSSLQAEAWKPDGSGWQPLAINTAGLALVRADQEGRDIEGYRRAIRHLCGDVLPDDILFQMEMPFITCPQKRVTDLDAESMARVPHPLRPMQTPRSSLFPAVVGPCFHSLSLCVPPPPDRNVS